MTIINLREAEVISRIIQIKTGILLKRAVAETNGVKVSKVMSIRKIKTCQIMVIIIITHPLFEEKILGLMTPEERKTFTKREKNSQGERILGPGKIPTEEEKIHLKEGMISTEEEMIHLKEEKIHTEEEMIHLEEKISTEEEKIHLEEKIHIKEEKILIDETNTVPGNIHEQDETIPEHRETIPEHRGKTPENGERTPEQEEKTHGPEEVNIEGKTYNFRGKMNGFLKLEMIEDLTFLTEKTTFMKREVKLKKETITLLTKEAYQIFQKKEIMERGETITLLTQKKEAYQIFQKKEIMERGETQMINGKKSLYADQEMNILRLIFLLLMLV